MCGIAGLWQTQASDSPSSEALWQMILTLKHRGPDAQDIWVGPGIGLAHARLSILDLNPRSNQPMHDPRTGNVITFNGEIYNYLEIREELTGLGYRFDTESDTEVILHAYTAWGVDCLSRFNGMWSFALWDKARDTLFCARDRFGIKPFCYAQTASGDWVFASEHKALWATYPELAQPFEPLLKTFVEDATPFSCFKESFYQGIYHLLPGHYMTWPRQQTQPMSVDFPQQTAFYRINQTPPQPEPTLDSAQAKYEQLLNDSLKLRFRSDVPVGCCMSGGVDSPTLVGLSTQLFKTQLKTFSCIYPDFPAVDESSYIRQNIQAFKTDAYTTTPVFSNFVDTLQQCVWEQDGPTGGPSVLSQRAVMALAKPVVTVLIDGQGADETLGGYHGYFPMKLNALARDVIKRPSWQSVQRLRDGLKTLRERYASKMGTPRPWKMMRQTLKGKGAKLGQWPFQSALSQQKAFPWDDLNTVMLQQTRSTMIDLLHYEDRNSMAVSLESRLPYLDYRLVDFAFGLDHHYKMDLDVTKLLLRKAAEKVLPEAVLHRRDKMGFETPGQHWMRQPEMIPFMDTLLNEPSSAMTALVSSAHLNRVRTVWQAIKSGEARPFSDECIVWRFATTHCWLEQLQQFRHSGRLPAFVGAPEPVAAG